MKLIIFAQKHGLLYNLPPYLDRRDASLLRHTGRTWSQLLPSHLPVRVIHKTDMSYLHIGWLNTSEMIGQGDVVWLPIPTIKHHIMNNPMRLFIHKDGMPARIEDTRRDYRNIIYCKRYNPYDSWMCAWKPIQLSYRSLLPRSEPDFGTNLVVYTLTISVNDQDLWRNAVGFDEWTFYHRDTLDGFIGSNDMLSTYAGRKRLCFDDETISHDISRFTFSSVELQPKLMAYMLEAVVGYYGPILKTLRLVAHSGKYAQPLTWSCDMNVDSPQREAVLHSLAFWAIKSQSDPHTIEYIETITGCDYNEESTLDAFDYDW